MKNYNHHHFKCLELLSPVVPHLTSAVLSSNNFSGAAALKVLSFRKLHFNSISNQGMHSTDWKFQIFQTLTFEFNAFVQYIITSDNIIFFKLIHCHYCHHDYNNDIISSDSGSWDWQGRRSEAEAYRPQTQSNPRGREKGHWWQW